MPRCVKGPVPGAPYALRLPRVRVPTVARPSPSAVPSVQAEFYTLLSEWTKTPGGAQNLNNLVLDANGTIAASQLGFVHTAPKDQARPKL